jgi:hypothetical protein
MLVNSVPHYEELTARGGINCANQIKQRSFTTTRGASDHYEFTPKKVKTKIALTS